ncbi:MAG: serine/threonine protein kinase [Lentisphaeria bacterium]|nr:serine/threonine protein kinase [Lentisphaeria bacterium]
MRIPDYDILQECGRGAYGEVWIARNRAGSLVALKTVARSEQIEKELAGLRSYSRIADSPHLIRIFHIGEVEDTLYYTMELADNLGSEKRYTPATLGNLLRRKGRFSPNETVELGNKLLAGLEVLHQAHLVHRDIKPENILCVNGEPKLSDIGLVRSISQSLSLGGTLGFIPPERLKSGSGGRSNADDLYALGKVLYCCLTGNGVEDYPSFPLSLLSDEYSHLNEVILTACNKNMALRFKTAEEFKNALENGVSPQKRLWGTAFRLRYRGIGLLIFVTLGGTWLFLRPQIVLPPSPEKPLELGEIQHRTYFSANVDVNDPDLNTSQTGYIDPVFRKYPPLQLDSAPRSQEVIFNRFTGKEWQDFHSKNLWRSGNTLRFLANAEGGIRLMLPLDYAYAIRFEINYAKLEDLLIFQVAALNAKGFDRSYYQWTLLKTQGKLTLKPLEYQAENGEQKFQIKPVKQPEDTPGFHRMEMLQTAKIFRLYIDDELVLYAPSFFLLGGYFTIISQGGNSNFVELRKFELLKISHDPKCPTEKQYQLPNER